MIKETRRMKRMAGRKKPVQGMSLTSLMDVFTILVFFLLSNSAANEAIEAPKIISLPASVVETKPKEKVIVLVTPQEILVQGVVVASTPEVMKNKSLVIESIRAELILQKSKLIDKEVKDIPEVNVLADQSIPFSLLKKVMSSCTSAGYAKISLAVIQKMNQSS